MRAVITAASVQVEQRIEDLRAAVTLGSEMAVLREQKDSLEEQKRVAESRGANARRSLDEAEAKIRALMSIEALDDTPATAGDTGDSDGG